MLVEGRSPWVPSARARVLGSLFCLLLGACASMEKERGHDDVSRLVAERTGRGTGWQKGEPAQRAIEQRVHELLAPGLTKERATQIALLNNPHLQQVYADLDVSQADLVQAGLLSNPTLSGSVGFHVGGPGHLEYEGSLVQSFLDIFLLPMRKRIAKEQFLAATLRVAHEALAVSAEVSRAFVEVQATEQMVALQQSTAFAGEATAMLARSQFEAGNISQRMLSTESANSEQERLDFERSKLELVERREHLNRLLGLWGDQVAWRVAGPMPALPALDPAPEQLENIAMRQRLDVAAARAQNKLLADALGVARSSRYTGVVNIGVHAHQDADGAQLLGPTISLELPIFDQRQAMIGRLDAQRRQAGRRLEELAVDARSEVRVASAKLAAAREASERYARRLLPQRAIELEQTQLEYNAMQIGLYELVQTKKEQLAATREYFSALRDYWVARADLESAVGGRIPDVVTKGGPR